MKTWPAALIRLVVGLLGGMIGLTTLAAPLRVAMTDFTTDDNSYRSATAAADCAAACQGRLASVAGLEWVERQELARAATELSLASFGLTGPGTALRLGRWVKADLTVVGRFASQPAAGRTLHLDVIDLDYADVLASRDLLLAARAEPPLALTAAELQQVTQTLQAMLTDSIRLRQAQPSQMVVAPLFFQNTGREHRLDFLEEDLLAALRHAATGRVRLVRFPRASQAIGESGLVASGLAEAGQDTWQKLADGYLWGGFTEVDPPDTPFAQVRVQVTLTLWDGRGDPRELTDTATVADLPARLPALARRVIETAQHQSTAVVRPDARQAVAAALLEQAKKIAATIEPHMADTDWTSFRPSPSFDLGEPHFYAPEELGQRHRRLNQLLAAACFFDPANQTAQRLRLAWLPHDRNAPWEFWSAWRKSRAWGEYYDRVGLTRDAVASANGIFAPYVMFTYETLTACHERYHGKGVPADTPPDVAVAWQTTLSRELTRRIHRVMHHPADIGQAQFAAAFVQGNLFYHALRCMEDPHDRTALIEDLWPCVRAGKDLPPAADRPPVSKPEVFPALAAIVRQTYAALGKPERAEALLGEARSRPTDKVPHPVHENEDLWPVPRLDVRPPTLTVALEPVPFPAGYSPAAITALAATSNQLWIGADSGQTIRQYIGSRDLDEWSDSTIWVLDPGTNQLINVSAPLAPHRRVNCLYPVTDQMWVALANNGMWCLDGTTRLAHRLGARDGLLSEEMYAIAQIGPALYFGGGPSDQGKLQSYDRATGRIAGVNLGGWIPRQAAPLRVIRLTAWQHWLLTDAGQPLLFNSDTHQWSNLQPTLFGPSLRQWGGWPLNNAIAAAVTDADGFWIGTEAGLVCHNPATGATRHWLTPYTRADPDPYWLAPLRQTVRNPPAEGTAPAMLAWPRTRLAGSVTALAGDGDYLWIATQTRDGFQHSAPSLEGSFIYLMHRPSRQWVGQFAVPRLVTVMAVFRHRLYLGGGFGATALTSLDTAPLLAIPQERWVADTIPDTEIERQIATLPALSRACYALFRGDDQQAVRLVGDVDLQQADLGTLFLLGYCYDPLGLNQPDRARRCFEEIRSRPIAPRWRKSAERALYGLSPTGR